MAAVTKFPPKSVNDMTDEELSEISRGDYIAEWELWLKIEIDTQVQPVKLPPYDTLTRELEMLIEYYYYSPTTSDAP